MNKMIFFAILLSVFVIIGCGDDDIVNIDEEVLVVLYPDSTVNVYYDSSIQFTYYVWNTTNDDVKWLVNDIEGGNDTVGTVDTNGIYTNLGNYPSLNDEVIVKVLSLADTSKYDSVRVILRDRFYVYVDIAGNDDSGKGTFKSPYRTITKGLDKALQGQIVRVSDGTFYENETFPLVPIYEVGVKGHGTSLTIIQPPPDSAAFRFEYERSYIEDLTIRGQNKQGIGIQFSGADDIDSLKTQNIVIENVHTAAIKTGLSNFVVFTDNEVINCVYGLVIDNPGEEILLAGSSFTDIDSIAVYLIDPITGKIDFNSVTIDGANIGLVISQGSFGFLHNSTFLNIDSIAVLNFNLVDLESGTGNDFSALDVWCIYNSSPNAVAALGNTWPAGDSAYIDTHYIYDDDENSSFGVVTF